MEIHTGFLSRKQSEFHTVQAAEQGLEQLHLTAGLGRVGSPSRGSSLPVQGWGHPCEKAFSGDACPSAAGYSAAGAEEL